MGAVEYIRWGNQSATGLACKPGYDRFDLSLVSHWRCHQFGSEPRGDLPRAQEVRVKGRGLRIEQKNRFSHAWRNLLEHFEPFAKDRQVDKSEPSDVATWSSQT